TEVLDTSPLFREWVEKAQAEGMAKGMAEGEAIGLRESIRTVLEVRFQTLDAELLAAVDAAHVDALKDTLRHITTGSLDDIHERLRRRPA
ncbi:MAG: hypothetical protein ACRDHE_13185, partial [Ktedonobacterales bacterium]